MDIREFFFKYRGYTPIPLILVVLIFARPTTRSILTGLLFMIIGELIRIWGVSYAGGATRTRNVGAPFLVTNGPFGHVRNPLYIGNMIMYSGAALMANIWEPWLVLFVVIFFGLQYALIVNLEEEKLRDLFGQQYEDYCKIVPRFLPRLAPYSGGEPVVPNVKGAIRSEKSTFIGFSIFVIIMIVRKYLG